jgi:hypothetical protein
MFWVVIPPIIRRAYNCIYSIWYLSHHYCYLPLSWKSWNLFECAVGGIRHPQHTQTCILLDIYWNILTMHGPINVKSPNNTSKWQMGFNSACKGFIFLVAVVLVVVVVVVNSFQLTVSWHAKSSSTGP